MIKHLQNNKEKVDYILRKYPETRDSDKKLWLAYMCIFKELKSKIGNEAYESLKGVVMADDTPAFESLRRVRQKLQESGQELQASDEVKEQRKVAAEDVSAWAKGLL
jgi:hypothetical protein